MFSEWNWLDSRHIYHTLELDFYRQIIHLAPPPDQHSCTKSATHTPSPHHTSDVITFSSAQDLFSLPIKSECLSQAPGPCHHLAPCYLPNTLASQQAQPNTLTPTSGLLPALFAYPEIPSAYSNPTSAYIQVPTPPESFP